MFLHLHRSIMWWMMSQYLWVMSQCTILLHLKEETVVRSILHMWVPTHHMWVQTHHMWVQTLHMWVQTLR